MADRYFTKRINGENVLIVDRELFMCWSNGVAIQRDNKGYIVCADLPEYNKAMKHLEKGKMIGLSIDGKIVSTMKDSQNGYIECLYNERN